MKFKKALSFDDVLLEPQRSNIISRSEVSLKSKIGNINFSFPVISSPMDTVTSAAMASTMLCFGGLGIIHRYNTPKQQASLILDVREELESTSSSNISKLSAALPASGDMQERSNLLYEAGCRIFCVDVAHGHHTLMESALKHLRDKFGKSITVIAGNVATAEAHGHLSEWGADAVRVGIGGGSICSTRIQTGHGVPTFQSVIDCRDHPSAAAIIADGGIKNSGDIVKCLAAGADLVMLGSMLAGTDESPGETFSDSDGKKYKVYRGMASVEAQVAWRGEARSLEGISTTIPHKGPVKKILKSISQNLKSGLSYSGCKNIGELRAKARFIQQTAASQQESHTHILSR